MNSEGRRLKKNGGNAFSDSSGMGKLFQRMKKVLLIIGASLRSQLRWAKQHIYTWLILAPLVLSITYLTASRLASNLSTDDFSFTQTAISGAMLFLCLIGLSLSRASAEVYHNQRPAVYFETLPVDADTHLYAALITRLARTLVVSFFLLAFKVILKERITATMVLLMLLFVILTALSEIFAALHWIHWGHKKNKAAALAAIFLVGGAAVLAGRLLALLMKNPETGYSSLLQGFLYGLTPAAVLFASVRLFHRRVRSSDVEYARRLEVAKNASLFNAVFFRRRFSPAIAAQLARDFQLTWRGFSSAVYVVALIVPLLLAALVAVLTTHVLPPVGDKLSWFETMQLAQVSAVKISCSLLSAALASLTPVLVAYELPHLWLERATGISGLDVWQAKISYTRMISLPAPFLAWVIGAALANVPLFYLLPLFVECLMLWWAVGSLIGGLSFEMPTRPGLALIVMATVGIGLGLAASFALLTSAFLPLGVMFYAQMMHGLTDRGRARARYYLLFGDD
jgi:hypothetical protein